MRAAKIDFEIEQGATFQRTLRYLNPIYRMNVEKLNSSNVTGATEPTWPDKKHNKVVDGGVTWKNGGTASENDMRELGTWQPQMEYEEGESVLTNEKPIDLSGYTARMHIRPKVDSDDPISILTTENGGISIDGPQGELTVVIQATETELFNGHKRGVYDLELVSAAQTDYPNGFVTRILEGKIKFIKEVTRPAGLDEISMSIEIDVQ